MARVFLRVRYGVGGGGATDSFSFLGVRGGCPLSISSVPSIFMVYYVPINLYQEKINILHTIFYDGPFSLAGV